MINNHKLMAITNQLFGIACDPLKDIYYEIDPEVGQGILSGLPVVLYGATQAEVYDKLFSAWTVDAGGSLDTYTPHDITVSVDYTETDGQQTAADAMAAVGGLMTRPIKHPDRDEWAMIVSTVVLSSAPDGPAKDALMAKHADKVDNGHNKSKADARADNWHGGA
jgi:hypothetical protein